MKSLLGGRKYFYIVSVDAFNYRLFCDDKNITPHKFNYVVFCVVFLFFDNEEV